MALEESAQLSEARERLMAILSDVEANNPEHHEIEIGAKRHLGRIEKAEGQYFDSRSLNRDVMEGLIANGTPSEKLMAMEALAKTVFAEGEFGLYTNLLTEIYRMVEASPELPQERGAAARVQLAQWAAGTNLDFVFAKEMLDHALATLHSSVGPDHLETLRAEALAISLRRGEAGMVNELLELGRSAVFSDGSPDAARISDHDLSVLRRLAEAETADGGKWNGYTHFINLAQALTHAGKYDDALEVLDGLEGFDATVQSGSVSLNTHFDFMRHEARGLVHLEAGEFEKSVEVFEGGVSEVLSMMREFRWVAALGASEEFHRFSQLYGGFYASAAWHAGAVPGRFDDYVDHAFRAVQLAGYGPAAAAVSRGSLRRAAEVPGLSKVIAEFEALSSFGTGSGARSSDDVIESAASRRTREARISLLHTEIDARFPEYFGLQIPDAIPLARVTGGSGDAPLIGEDEALIVILPLVSLAETKRGIPGLVLAVTHEGRAWAKLPISFRELAEDISLLHFHLDPSGRVPSTLANLRAPMSSIENTPEGQSAKGDFCI